MLRIREYNKITGKKIDLKELEKFGIKFQNDFRGGHYYCSRDFKISNKNHHLIPLNGTASKRFDNLYDLIIAGYVEKVEEE